VVVTPAAVSVALSLVPVIFGITRVATPSTAAAVPEVADRVSVSSKPFALRVVTDETVIAKVSVAVPYVAVTASCRSAKLTVVFLVVTT
jgi:hypothetical protein